METLFSYGSLLESSFLPMRIYTILAHFPTCSSISSYSSMSPKMLTCFQILFSVTIGMHFLHFKIFAVFFSRLFPLNIFLFIFQYSSYSLTSFASLRKLSKKEVHLPQTPSCLFQGTPNNMRGMYNSFNNILIEILIEIFIGIFISIFIDIFIINMVSR